MLSPKFGSVRFSSRATRRLFFLRMEGLGWRTFLVTFCFCLPLLNVLWECFFFLRGNIPSRSSVRRGCLTKGMTRAPLKDWENGLPTADFDPAKYEAGRLFPTVKICFLNKHAFLAGRDVFWKTKHTFDTRRGQGSSPSIEGQEWSWENPRIRGLYATALF